MRTKSVRLLGRARRAYVWFRFGLAERFDLLTFVGCKARPMCHRRGLDGRPTVAVRCRRPGRITGIRILSVRGADVWQIHGGHNCHIVVLIVAAGTALARLSNPDFRTACCRSTGRDMVSAATCPCGYDLPGGVLVGFSPQSLQCLRCAQVVVAGDDAHDRHACLKGCESVRVHAQHVYGVCFELI